MYFNLFNYVIKWNSRKLINIHTNKKIEFSQEISKPYQDFRRIAVIQYSQDFVKISMYFPELVFL